MKKELSHLDEQGNATMVDVGEKPDTVRRAVAEGSLYASDEILSRIASGDIPKGDVLSVGRIAGIMGAKRTPELIPMCHPLMITSAAVDLAVLPEEGRIRVQATVGNKGVTGVEMEALTAVSTALLAVYDMCKAIDKAMVIGEVRLLKKTGGKSGDWTRPEEAVR